MDAAVAKHIAALKDEDSGVRSHAAEALGRIGDSSAVPALSEALKDKEEGVRSSAAIALGNIGYVSTVPALMEALKDESWLVRSSAAFGLGRIGDSTAVPALLEALKDENRDVRSSAAVALEMMGDAVTLPRKVLAYSSLSPKQKIETLNALRQIRYKDYGVTLRYNVPGTRRLAQLVLKEKDAEARVGAQQVLDWLNGNTTLLRAVEVNPADTRDLLVAYEGGTPEAQPETLLRAAEEVAPNAEPSEERSAWWKRLFKQEKERR